MTATSRAFLGMQKSPLPAAITEKLVREFRLHLNRQPGVTANLKLKTQNYYLIALRAFLKFLRKLGLESLSPEKIELAKVSSRDLDLITQEELNRLMRGPQGTRSQRSATGQY